MNMVRTIFVTAFLFSSAAKAELKVYRTQTLSGTELEKALETLTDFEKLYLAGSCIHTGGMKASPFALAAVGYRVEAVSVEESANEIKFGIVPVGYNTIHYTCKR